MTRVLLRLLLPADVAAPLVPIDPRTMSGRLRPLQRLRLERGLGMLKKGLLTWSGWPEIAKREYGGLLTTRVGVVGRAFALGESRCRWSTLATFVCTNTGTTWN